MNCLLQWKTSLSATCIHAAMCRSERLYPVDAAVADKLAEPADRLIGEMATISSDPADLLLYVCSLSTEYENNRELAARTLAKVRGLNEQDDRHVNSVAGAISDLKAALLGVTPHLAADLEVRGRPLREQWEAFGPGLLREIGRLTDKLAVPEKADVVLVAPYVGGHGRAHLPTNRIIVEAVLYHPTPHLPETLRVAWLLSQLNCDLPRFADAIPSGKLTQIAGASMLLATLAAAQSLEMVRFDRSLVELALSTWRFPLPGASVDKLLSWWSTYESGRDRWQVALGALGALLGRN